ncbi:acyloxyacyl hydrolase [Rhodanobacter sp. A1T4]|jgi:hypothetical protein|uniref:acyloxyacyl hydrolase n=1 Tax=Rhodanobacter sp. A1T4 TaxID=2723087 RepID=UPI00161B4E49|nr:acyloxyacyl hydrolase [Rhodanobacter sp. A1T4]MBB6247341.1 hypothetical protein [Rhodanobacter sp. A1T4]
MRLPAKSLRAALALALLSLTLPAAATTFEVEAGRSYSNSHGTNAAFVEGVFDAQPIGSSLFSWEPDVSLGWLDGRDLYEHHIEGKNTRENAFLAGAGARFQYGQQGDWYRHLFFSFQPTYNTGRTPGLSGPLEFASTFGWQGKHFSLQLRHISNAGLHEPNRGETMALAGLSF